MKKLLTIFFSSSLLFGAGFFLSAPAVAEQPVIAIIIDDIGWRKQDDLQSIDLPGALTYAVLPQTPNAKLMSETIVSKGKEVMLHIPMEARKDNHLLGPGALTTDMSQEEFIATIEANFASVPDAVGINNHMGSLLTNHELSMHRLMNALQRPNAPFFIDSKTTNTSVPSETAKLYGIANTKRDVFLDHEQGKDYVIKQFAKLVEVAKLNGSALGIAHPHPETTEALDFLLSNLQEHGVKLITISEFMKYRDQGSFQWRTSATPSISAVEN